MAIMITIIENPEPEKGDGSRLVLAVVVAGVVISAMVTMMTTRAITRTTTNKMAEISAMNIHSTATMNIEEEVLVGVLVAIVTDDDETSVHKTKNAIFTSIVR